MAFLGRHAVLNHSSIARGSPQTGDILMVDDRYEGIILVDRKIKRISWCSGQMGKKVTRQACLSSQMARTSR